MKKSTCFRVAIKSALALVGIPALINHIVFKRANVKQKAKMKENYFEWRHGNIRYVTAGSGQPLLLIHDIAPGSGLHEWKKSITALSRHYKVYSPDLLGFGYSDKPGISYSSYLYVTLINDFIHEVIGEKALVAVSGVSAAYTVMGYSFRPDLYKKMLLVSPSLGPAGENGKRDLMGRLMELPVLGTTLYNIMTSKAYIRDSLSGSISRSENFAATVNQYYYAAHFGGSNAKYPIAAFLSGFLSVPAGDKLKQVKIPVHTVWDGDFMPEESNCATGLTIIQGGKLWPHMETPKAFYKVCRRFFK